MALGNKEIELQFRVSNREVLLKFLDNNATKTASVHMVDDYFTPSHRNFLNQRPIDEWLRIRRSDNNYSITYKKCHRDQDNNNSYRDEYESSLGDINSMYKIFDVLDFRKIVTVDKQRVTYIYNKDYEFAIDSVKQLGDFIEIEYIGEKNIEPKIFYQDTLDLLTKIGIKNIEINHIGYPAMILNLQNNTTDKS